MIIIHAQHDNVRDRSEYAIQVCMQVFYTFASLPHHSIISDEDQYEVVKLPPVYKEHAVLQYIYI